MNRSVMVTLVSPWNSSADSSFFGRMKKIVTGQKDISINDIVDETQKVKDNVKDLSENYVINNIKKYNELISEMKNEVNSKSWFFLKKSDADKFGIILNGVEQIKDFYLGLNKNKVRIKKQMISYVNDIVNFSGEIVAKISKEKLDKGTLERDFEIIDLVNGYSQEEREIKRKGYLKRTAFAEQRIKSLFDFKNNYDRILPVMKNTDESIDRFIFVVEESAAVYSDAYRTLKLQKDISNAYRTIEELKSLDYLSEDLKKSWSELEIIIEDLTDQIVVFNEDSLRKGMSFQ